MTKLTMHSVARRQLAARQGPPRRTAEGKGSRPRDPLRLPRWAGAVIGLLILTVIVFLGIRLVVDGRHLLAGTVPAADTFEHRYVTNAVPAYLHIVPGAIYLVGAPLQLSRRFRRRHLAFHRRLGRVLLPCGLLSGVFALVFGSLHSYGGAAEASAAVVFGGWFIAALLLAFRAIRRGDVRTHRRWMIRAFAVALAVGTIRVWVGIFQLSGLLNLEDSFGPAFWISLVSHAVVAEWWLHRTAPASTRSPAPVHG